MGGRAMRKTASAGSGLGSVVGVTRRGRFLVGLQATRASRVRACGDEEGACRGEGGIAAGAGRGRRVTGGGLRRGCGWAATRWVGRDA
jgi:hypothetical protein